MVRVAFPGARSRKIDEGGAAVGEANQHESTAADVAGLRVCHGERKPDRDRGVDGVATGAQNFQADVDGLWLLSDDHGVIGPDGLAGESRHRKKDTERAAPGESPQTEAHEMILANCAVEPHKSPKVLAKTKLFLLHQPRKHLMDCPQTRR